MVFHFYVTSNEIENSFKLVSHLAGNSVVGNTVSAISHGIGTWQDIKHNNNVGAIIDGVETLVNTTLAIVDGMYGDWI